MRKKHLKWSSSSIKRWTENRWKISSTGKSAGQQIADSDNAPFPEHVYYDAERLTATVYFTLKQNESADGTIDPSHVEFKFTGKDSYGFTMNTQNDQFTGFSGVV